MVSPPTPSSALFLPHLDDLIVLLPLEVWKDEIFWQENEFFSPLTRPCLFFLRTRGCPVGDWEGTHESAFFSPTKEAQ